MINSTIEVLMVWLSLITKVMSGWGDLGWKKRKGKEIRRKWWYLFCLIVKKNWKRKNK